MKVMKKGGETRKMVKRVGNYLVDEHGAALAKDIVAVGKYSCRYDHIYEVQIWYMGQNESVDLRYRKKIDRDAMLDALLEAIQIDSR
jgi:hypothetical protein